MNHKQQLRVKLLREEGKTFKEIGEIMGFSRQRAHQIFTGGPIYKDLSPEEKRRRYEASKERRKAIIKSGERKILINF